MANVRRFIRHPSDLAIEVCEELAGPPATRPMKNIGCGGLAFHSPRSLPPDARVTLRLPGLQPPCDLPEARVAWCRREGPGYAIGVRFGGADEAFLVRMVEQVCHIESYRRRMERAGRGLTSEQAAEEWIARHAAGFPDP